MLSKKVSSCIQELELAVALCTGSAQQVCRNMLGLLTQFNQEVQEIGKSSTSRLQGGLVQWTLELVGHVFLGH